MSYAKALDNAIALAGGKSALGRLLGVSHEAVSNWPKRGVPLARAMQIESVLGIQADTLCPSPMASIPAAKPVSPSSPPPAPRTLLDQAIAKAGGKVKLLAEVLGVGRDQVNYWRQNGIPRRHAVMIERHYGIDADALIASLPDR